MPHVALWIHGKISGSAAENIESQMQNWRSDFPEENALALAERMVSRLKKTIRSWLRKMANASFDQIRFH